MSTRKSDKSNYVIGSITESKKGASLLVERVQLTQAGLTALTTTVKSIGNGNGRDAESTSICAIQPDTKKSAKHSS